MRVFRIFLTLLIFHFFILSCSEYFFRNPHPEITVYPTSIDFGEVRTGESKTFYATISNEGGGDLSIFDITIMDNRGSFSIVEYPVLLKGGHSGYIELLYEPLIDGSDYGTGVISSNDSDESSVYIDLSGKGVTPEPDSPPRCNIISPSDGEVYHEDEYIPFFLSIIDDENDPDELTFTFISNIDGIIAYGSPDEDGSVEFSSKLTSGVHTLSLEAEDPGGLSCLTSSECIVNSLPTAMIISPLANSTHFSTATIIFEGIVSDDEDPPTILDVRWESDIDGIIGYSAPSSTGEVTSSSSLSPGEHTISLYATDTYGGIGADSITITIIDCGVWDTSTSSWMKYPCSPVLEGTPYEWDSEGVWNPSVVKVGDTYYMAYHGFDGSNMRIGIATSSDGIVWEKYSGNPVILEGAQGDFDDSHAAFPTLIFDNSIFYIYYAGAGETWKIGLAYSNDGFTYEKYEGNPVLSVGEEGDWDYYLIGGPSALLTDEGDFYLFYNGSNGEEMNIGLAFSETLFDLVKYPSNPVLHTGEPGQWDSEQVYQPSVLYQGERYHLFFEGSDDSNRSIGYATSPDLVYWTKFDGNPVLMNGGTLAFDDLYVLTPSVIFEEPYFKMWYGGHSGTSLSIGYAVNRIPEILLETPVNGDVFTTGEEILFSGTITDSGNLEGIEVRLLNEEEETIEATNPNAAGEFEMTVTFSTSGSTDLSIEAEDEGGLKDRLSLSLILT